MLQGHNVRTRELLQLPGQEHEEFNAKEYNIPAVRNWTRSQMCELAHRDKFYATRVTRRK